MFSHALLAAPGTPVSPLSGRHGDDEEEALITHYPWTASCRRGTAWPFTEAWARWPT